MIHPLSGVPLSSKGPALNKVGPHKPTPFPSGKGLGPRKIRTHEKEFNREKKKQNATEE